MEAKNLPCGCIAFRDEQMPDFRFVWYCDAHTKEHGTSFQMQSHMEVSNPNYEARERDVERVVTYLKGGKVATVHEISKALAMQEIIVAMSLQHLGKKNLLGYTPDKNRRYFLKI